eukprot:jgi/Mesen1/6513/ME000332S05517
MNSTNSTGFHLSTLHEVIGTSSNYVILMLLLSAVGLAVVVRSAAYLIRALWIVFLRPGKNLRRYGAWAVVTGATDGIGKAFAERLAAKKINVVLVSRTQEKLTELAGQLEGKYGVQTRTVQVDIANPDMASSLKKIENAIADLEVGILVNNVGMSYPYAKFFHEIDSELITNLIRINVEATTKITHLVIPAMLKRKKGAIVNIGSGAATVLPSDPLYAVYAGTKAYVDQFSRTLFVEYRDRGIDVQCQAPLYVATKLAKIRHASLTCPSARTYAAYALRWIGREPRCTPYWAHSIMWWAVWMLPQPVVDAVRLQQNLGIRKRALAKEAKAKQAQ